MSNFAISGLLNSFFLDCYYGRLGVRKYYVFSVPALSDQVKFQVYYIDLSTENWGFSWEMFFNLNFSMDDVCTGCCIVLFKSIGEDMDIVGIFFLDFFKFFLECYRVGGFFLLYLQRLKSVLGVMIFRGWGIKLFCEF